MDDDFNTGGATSDLFQLLSALNKFIDDQQLEDAQRCESVVISSFVRGTETLRELSAILGLFLRPQRTAGGGPDEGLLDNLMSLLIDLRTNARAQKDFATSDQIRDRLTAAGVALEDRKDGTSWKLDN